MSKCDNIDTVSHLAARPSHYWGHGGHGVRVPETGARQSDNVHVGEWSLVARVTCTTADTGRGWQLLAELFVIYTCTKDRIGGRVMIT